MLYRNVAWTPGNEQSWSSAPSGRRARHLAAYGGHERLQCRQHLPTVSGLGVLLSPVQARLEICMVADGHEALHHSDLLLMGRLVQPPCAAAC